MTVRVESLTKNFGNFRAVDNVSFELQPGEVTGFVGGNGSGKTTTMRMMLDLLSPSSGHTHFDGQTYGALEHPRSTVGAVVDRIGAHPSHSARDHLTMLCESAGLPATRVSDALEAVGLTDVADKAIGRYSMGMTQRCALAAALLGDPKTLILDEPANGLDPAGIRWIRQMVRQWADEGRAVLVSTHQLAELAAVVDKVVVLREGRVLFFGTADTLRGMSSSLENAVLEMIDGTDREWATR